MKKNQKVTNEQKARAVEIAIQGGDPLAYLQECGSENPTSLWYTIRMWLKAKEPEKYEAVMAAYTPRYGKPKKAKKTEPAEKVETVETVETVEEVPKAEKKPKITAPLMFDGMEACGWKCASGTFCSSGNGFIDFDNGVDTLSMRVEEWKAFLRDLMKASLALGIDLGVTMRD